MAKRKDAHCSSSPTHLFQLFENGISAIPVKKSDNIFKQLEARDLSREEQDIIHQRVTHVQNLFEEYNKRELDRKIAELQDVCTELTKEEAFLVLQKCNENEDEAAILLTSDPTFLETIRQAQKTKIEAVVSGDASSFVGRFQSRKKPAVSTVSANRVDASIVGWRNWERRVPSGSFGSLSWGKRACRSVASRKPVQLCQLANLKAAIAFSPSVNTNRHRSRRSSRLQEKFSEISETEDEETDSSDDEYRLKSYRISKGIALGDRAISRSGYTCRGRVKQKAQKRVEVLNVGKLNMMKGWYNAGYIFPLGFKSRTSFRSSVVLNAMSLHQCEIVKGKFWPLPTFMVTVSDRPHEPLISKSCTGCWTSVLRRINNEIVKRRKAGENIPPPPKTAIAGPEYFGLVQEDSVERIESLDPDQRCVIYWAGKQEREMALLSLPSCKIQTTGTSTGRKKRTKASRFPRWQFEESDDEKDVAPVEEEEGSDFEYKINKWSTIDRSERYKRRCIQKGLPVEEPDSDDNPLAGFIDPVTLETVVTPAISPYGHVMGMATWRAYLSNSNLCPFTKKPLTIEQCTLITKHNFHKYKDKISSV